MDLNRIGLLAVGSTQTITLRGDYATAYRIETQAARAVSDTGRLNAYLQDRAEGFELSIPLTFVDSETRHALNSWYRADARLQVLFYNSSVNHEVRIFQQNAPITHQSMNQTTLWDGFLRLKTITATTSAGKGWFMLDHSSYGVLNVAYNPLG